MSKLRPFVHQIRQPRRTSSQTRISSATHTDPINAYIFEHMLKIRTKFQDVQRISNEPMMKIFQELKESTMQLNID